MDDKKRDRAMSDQERDSMLRLKEAVELNEIRRPGFGKLLQRVALQYPRMTDEELIVKTKMVYSSPTTATPRGSRVMIGANPDYLAGRDR